MESTSSGAWPTTQMEATATSALPTLSTTELADAGCSSEGRSFSEGDGTRVRSGRDGGLQPLSRPRLCVNCSRHFEGCGAGTRTPGKSLFFTQWVLEVPNSLRIPSRLE